MHLQIFRIYNISDICKLNLIKQISQEIKLVRENQDGFLIFIVTYNHVPNI